MITQFIYLFVVHSGLKTGLKYFFCHRGLKPLILVNLVHNMTSVFNFVYVPRGGVELSYEHAKILNICLEYFNVYQRTINLNYIKKIKSKVD